MSLRSQALVHFANLETLRTVGVRRSVYELLYSDDAPWDIGHHQPVVEELEKQGAFCGRILDIGCGCGSNAMFLASRGHHVVGIDYVEAVIKQAKQTAAEIQYESPPQFLHKDLFQALELNGSFGTVLDSATFHGLSDTQRVEYAQVVRNVTELGAVLYIICFSVEETRLGGPRRISNEELEQTFHGPWQIQSIRPCRFFAKGFDGGARALLCSIRKLAD